MEAASQCNTCSTMPAFHPRTVSRFLERLQEASAPTAAGSSSEQRAAAAEGGSIAGQQHAGQAAAAANGSASAPAELDVHALLGRMTLEVVGRSAFGVDFITEGDEQDLKEGKPNLVAAVKVRLGQP